jgi:hypothetical protein
VVAVVVAVAVVVVDVVAALDIDWCGVFITDALTDIRLEVNKDTFLGEPLIVSLNNT